MWLFLPDAFFSIVKHRDYDSLLLVRARLKGDIERYFPNANVVELPNADYRFRAYIDRHAVELVVRMATESINYPDFKSQVDKADTLRKGAYLDVWSAMQRAQQKQQGKRVIGADRDLVDRTELLHLLDAVLMGDNDDAEERAQRMRDKLLAGGA